MDLAVLIIAFFVLLFLGIPIAIALCASAILYLVLYPDIPLIIIGQQMLKVVGYDFAQDYAIRLLTMAMIAVFAVIKLVGCVKLFTGSKQKLSGGRNVPAAANRDTPQMHCICGVSFFCAGKMEAADKKAPPFGGAFCKNKGRRLTSYP